MGSIWEGVGTLWGLSRVLLDASWPFWERSKPSFFQALGQDGLQEAFWLDFWSIWEGLGGVLGRFGEAFGRGLEALGASWAIFWRSFWGLYSECVPKGLLEASGLHFGSILEGFGTELGRVLGRFWESLEARVHFKRQPLQTHKVQPFQRFAA